MGSQGVNLVTWTKEMEDLYNAVKPDPEPPCDCRKCTRRYGECAEFTALNHPDRPYNRGACGWFNPEGSQGVNAE